MVLQALGEEWEEGLPGRYCGLQSLSSSFTGWMWLRQLLPTPHFPCVESLLEKRAEKMSPCVGFNHLHETSQPCKSWDDGPYPDPQWQCQWMCLCSSVSWDGLAWSNGSESEAYALKI